MVQKKLEMRIYSFFIAGIAFFMLGVVYYLIQKMPTRFTTESIHEVISNRQLVSLNLSSFLKKNEYPEQMNLLWKDSAVLGNIKYTLSTSLQKEAEKLLNLYKPDYGALFAMDATTGRVLAMASYERHAETPINYNLQATFPAASLFKIVTASAAIDKAGLQPAHRIRYNGGAYTLYRKNVMTDKITRWTNVISLKDAFARSINTAFGRITLENLEPSDIAHYADRFMFNQYIPSDFPVEEGTAYVPDEKGFELTEVASGYNKKNRISPVQGAMIAAAIANDGIMLIPTIVDSITNVNNSDVLYEHSPVTAGEIISVESAKKIRELMNSTVVSGTSRKSFYPLLKNRKFQDVEMGGKTGHLTGDKPRGRVDWFIGYAYDQDQKIALAALTINKEFWTVKSSFLGKSLIKSHFTESFHIANQNKNEDE
ncbi:MAG TPA: penicillin-binding transpeptidase domain-containing protein [Pseudobdellovibrionaceae bacterium]|nr:penicillin-binding transpeptidase domain-containing protein [Pseudobdellovibrionaceae bacterium]